MAKWKQITDEVLNDEARLVRVVVASVSIVREASWDDGERYMDAGFDSIDEARGWWSYENSVSQQKLEGIFEPTHWAEMPDD